MNLRKTARKRVMTICEYDKESGYIFPNNDDRKVVHDIGMDNLEQLLKLAEQDEVWAQNVREEVRQRLLDPSIPPTRFLDENRIRNTAGTVITYPFGERIITFNSKRHFYRGENQEYPSSLPSLRRKTIGMSAYEEELTWIIAEMRIRQFWYFIWKFSIVPYWEANLCDVNYHALAQHYGLDTYLIDLTNDFKTALFFATCKYNYEEDCYEPLTQEDVDGDFKYGIIYHTPNWTIDFNNMVSNFWYMEHMYDKQMPDLCSGDMDGYAFQIGFQPFLRCHYQSGYIFPMRFSCSLQEDYRFERLRFRQSVALSERVFNMMDKGQKIFPREGITKARSIIQDIKECTSFSIYDVKDMWDYDHVNRSIFLTMEDLCTALKTKGIQIVNDDVDQFMISDDLRESINAMYDNRNVLDEIGGMFHQKPEDAEYRQRRREEILQGGMDAEE